MKKLSNEEIVYTYDELIDLYNFFKNLEPLTSIEEYLDSYNGIWFVMISKTLDSQFCVTGHDVTKFLCMHAAINFKYISMHLLTGAKKDRILTSLNIQKKLENII